MKRLKEEAENDKEKLLNHLLEGEYKFYQLLTDLEYEIENDVSHNVVVLESKLIKLEISPERIDRIKKLVSLS